MTEKKTRDDRNVKGERSKRFDIYLSGTDLECFESIVSRFTGIMGKNGTIKKNDAIRAVLPLYSKALSYIDKEALPKRGRIGTPEHEYYLEKLRQCVEEAFLSMLITELKSQGCEVAELKRREEEGIDPSIPRGPYHGLPLKDLGG